MPFMLEPIESFVPPDVVCDRAFHAMVADAIEDAEKECKSDEGLTVSERHAIADAVVYPSLRQAIEFLQKTKRARFLTSLTSSGWN